MAFDLAGGGPRVRPSMNVTPLVDVVLVLLIIFMVITPMLIKQFWVRTPPRDDDRDQPALADVKQPVILTVGDDGRAEINKVPVADAELPGKLRRIFAARGEHVLFFDAAGGVEFGRAMEVMDLARGGGALHIVTLHEAIQ